MNDSEWMKDPLLASIPVHKLQFLQTLVFEVKDLDRKELIRFLIGVSGKAKSESINFSKEEMSTITSALKKYASEEDIQRIDKIMSMKRNHA